MIVGIILAAGKGTRMGLSDKNKTALEFNGKPLIQYGVDLFLPFCEEILVVVGAHAESVKGAVTPNPKVGFVTQENQEGTGHALKVALEDLKKRNITPDQVLVGYGDHMMFYPSKVIDDLIDLNDPRYCMIISFVSTDAPNTSGFGRVVRNKHNEVIKLVEEKDATEDERKIKEINAGLYCFDFDFLSKNIDLLEKSKVTGESYITDLVGLAASSSCRVDALKVPFKYVGIGINTKEQVLESQKLHKNRNIV